MLPAEVLEARGGGWGGSGKEKQAQVTPVLQCQRKEGRLREKMYLKIKIWELTTLISSPSERTGKNQNLKKHES